MRFKPLAPGLAQKLIHGIEDELSGLSNQRIGDIKNMMCPRCQSSMAPLLYAPAVFGPDDPLPRMVATCQVCGATIDPKTQIVLATGDPRLVDEGLPLVRGEDD